MSEEPDRDKGETGLEFEWEFSLSVSDGASAQKLLLPSDWVLAQEDEIEKIKTHVFNLQQGDFFKNVSDADMESAIESVTVTIFSALLQYRFFKMFDMELTLNSKSASNLKKIGDTAEKLLNGLTELSNQSPSKFRSIEEAYERKMVSENSPGSLLLQVTAITEAVTHVRPGRPGRGRGAPKRYHDENLICFLANAYERIPGNIARVSAKPGGNNPKGPFVRFIKGCLSVIDPGRAEFLSKSTIQRALDERRQLEQ